MWAQVYLRPAVRLAGRIEKQWRLLTPKLERIIELDVRAREERLREFQVSDFVECKYGPGEIDRDKVHQCRRPVLDMDDASIVESLVESPERAEGPDRPQEPDWPGDG